MTAETKHKIVRTVFISAIFALFALMFWPFATPVLIAGLFAYALHDVVTRMTVKKNLKRRTASVLLILGLIVFVAAPLSFIILTAVETVKSYVEAGVENTSVFKYSSQLLSDITDYVRSVTERFNLQSSIPKIKNYFAQFSSSLGSHVTKVFAAIPKLAMSLIVFFLALYFFLNESDSIKKLILRYDLLPRHDLDKINAMVKRSSFQALIASLLIAAAQALLIATFAYFCDYTEFFLVFIIAFMFALIPVVGSGPVPLFLALISFIQGNTGAGIAMLVCLGIASTVDNIIKAFIIRGDDDRIHPIVSLLALIGGLIVYGMPGILLGPVLTQMAFNILDIQHSGEKSGEFKADSDL